MNENRKSAQSEDSQIQAIRARILDAMWLEVPFDGWGEAAFEAALKSTDIDENTARLAFPRGAGDVAIFAHKEDDHKMMNALGARIEGITSVSQKIRNAIALRLEIAGAHKDAVRRAASHFALPQNALMGSQLIWHTADCIWRAIGDEAQGFEYFSKRSSLSAVYSASFLYWLQDSSEDNANTQEFIARRIEDMGSFGKFTAKFKRKPA